jgi:hypothetical protein
MKKTHKLRLHHSPKPFRLFFNLLNNPQDTLMLSPKDALHRDPTKILPRLTTPNFQPKQNASALYYRHL